MMTRAIAVLVLALGALAGAPASARATGGEQEAAKREDLEATLVALKGTVDVKRPEDKEWVAA